MKPETRRYLVPYSKSTIEFDLPPGMRGTVAVSKPAEPLADVEGAIAESLAHPTGSPPLREMARRGDAGDENVTLLCGIGMHRPSTPEEKVAKLGAGVVARYRVIDSEPQNPGALVDLGITPGGVPVSAHRAAVEADLLIATGLVEPHQYAGYSGGRKTLAVGAAGEALIAHTHGPAFIDHPGTRLGRIEGNPFHKAITEAARRAGLHFILNVVLDDDKRVVCVKAGEPVETHQQLVSFARSIYEVEIPHQYDVAIGGVGFPKDANLYQASRAASYLFFAPAPVVKPGGFLIVPARCDPSWTTPAGTATRRASSGPLSWPGYWSGRGCSSSAASARTWWRPAR